MEEIRVAPAVQWTGDRMAANDIEQLGEPACGCFPRPDGWVRAAQELPRARRRARRRCVGACRADAALRRGLVADLESALAKPGSSHRRRRRAPAHDASRERRTRAPAPPRRGGRSRPLDQLEAPAGSAGGGTAHGGAMAAALVVMAASARAAGRCGRVAAQAKRLATRLTRSASDDAEALAAVLATACADTEPAAPSARDFEPRAGARPRRRGAARDRRGCADVAELAALPSPRAASRHLRPDARPRPLLAAAAARAAAHLVEVNLATVPGDGARASRRTPRRAGDPRDALWVSDVSGSRRRWLAPAWSLTARCRRPDRDPADWPERVDARMGVRRRNRRRRRGLHPRQRRRRDHPLVGEVDERRRGRRWTRRACAIASRTS